MVLISFEETPFIRIVGLPKITVNLIQDSRSLVRDLNGLLCDFQTQTLQLQTARSVNISKLYHCLYIVRDVLTQTNNAVQGAGPVWRTIDAQLRDKFHGSYGTRSSLPPQ